MRRGGILLAVDSGAASTAAVRAAGFLASALHAPVAVLYVHPIAASGADPSPDRRAASHLNRLGIKAEVVIRAGDPADEILSASRDLHARLIVMGCRGRSAITGLLLGSVSREVTARATCPVLVVRPGADSWPVHRILLAIEGVAGSESLASTTATLAQALNAEVVVVHVSYPAGERIERGLYHARQTHGEQGVASAVQRLARSGVAASSLSVVSVGGVSRALGRAARLVDAQLIVMGAHEPAEPGERAGTELATSVAHRTVRPVLVMRETGAP